MNERVSDYNWNTSSISAPYKTCTASQLHVARQLLRNCQVFTSTRACERLRERNGWTWTGFAHLKRKLTKVSDVKIKEEIFVKVERSHTSEMFKWLSTKLLCERENKKINIFGIGEKYYNIYTFPQLETDIFKNLSRNVIRWKMSTSDYVYVYRRTYCLENYNRNTIRLVKVTENTHQWK